MKKAHRLIIHISCVVAALAGSHASFAFVDTSSVAKKALTPELELNFVTDGAVIAAGLTFGATLELILSTGELQPQMPLDPSVLSPIDRPFALSDETVNNAGILSNLGAATAIAYALFDVGLAAVIDRKQSPWAYAAIYAETSALNWALTDLVKIAVRRPRPRAYRQLRMTGTPTQVTDDALSFYSGHAAIVAGLSGTATYLAFLRSPDGVEPWIVLGGGIAITTFVSINRVRARDHFPTDVIAGAIAGAAVGVLVPHLHRRELDIGGTKFAIVPDVGPEGGGGLSVVGSF